jgi:DNA-binding protein Fis
MMVRGGAAAGEVVMQHASTTSPSCAAEWLGTGNTLRKKLVEHKLID